jgi:hypothetical protein
MSDSQQFTDVPWASSPASAKASRTPARRGCGLAFAVLGVLLLLGVLLGYGLADRIRRDRAVLDLKFDSPVATLPADELLALFTANEVQAESLTKGFVVVVSGKVNTIGKESGGRAYVGIGSGLLGSVRAVFAKDRLVDVRSLAKGDTVTVRGLVVGKTVVGQIELEACRVDAK